MTTRLRVSVADVQLTLADGKQAVAQGEPRSASFAQGQRDFRHRDAVEPFDSEVQREFAHVALFIDHAGIQHVIDGRTLALGCGPQDFGQSGDVLATGAASWFNQKLGHGRRLLVP